MWSTRERCLDEAEDRDEDEDGGAAVEPHSEASSRSSFSPSFAKILDDDIGASARGTLVLIPSARGMLSSSSPSFAKLLDGDLGASARGTLALALAPDGDEASFPAGY